MFFFLLESYVSLVISFLISEYVLNKRALFSATSVLLFLPALCVPAAPYVTSIARAVFDFFSYFIHAPTATSTAAPPSIADLASLPQSTFSVDGAFFLDLANTFVLSFLLSLLFVGLGLSLASSTCRKQQLQTQTSLRCLCTCFLSSLSCVFVFLHVFGNSLSPDPSSTFKRAALCVIYVSALYLSWLRKDEHIPLLLFITELSSAMTTTLVMFPFFGLLIAMCFLALSSVFEVLRLNTTYLDGPIYYAVLYGPFMTAFFLLQRRFAFLRYDVLPK